MILFSNVLLWLWYQLCLRETNGKHSAVTSSTKYLQDIIYYTKMSSASTTFNIPFGKPGKCFFFI